MGTLTLGATLVVATNAGLSLGPCGPKPPTAEEFSVERYLGDWYAQLTVAAPFNPEGVRCTRVQYDLFDNGTLSVYNTGTLMDGSFDEICGWAEQADPENAPGDLIVYFYGSPGDYWVLDTYFDSFSSVYSCTEGLVDGVVKYEYAFILTREKYPSEETLEKAFDAYTRNNINLDWYPIPQYDDCINDPPG